MLLLRVNKADVLFCPVVAALAQLSHTQLCVDFFWHVSPLITNLSQCYHPTNYSGRLHFATPNATADFFTI